MSNRLETYKSLEKYYLRKSKGKQKEGVKEILKLYKDGKIFSKITIQRELNRYLGQSFKSEKERDSYYDKTKETANLNLTNLLRESKKVEYDFKKVKPCQTI